MGQRSFEQSLVNARQFLSDLRQNNNRDWFKANKSTYDATVKEPGHRIGIEMAAHLRALTGKELDHKLFRINRDVRFSKDKTPYNSHLHLLWAASGGPGFFFGVSPDYISAGCGVMGLQKGDLDAYRAYVDRTGNEVEGVVSTLKNAGFRMDDAELKRVPAPYDKEHAHGDLLRRKSLAIWYDFDRIPSENDVTAAFSQLLPVYEICSAFSKA